MKLCLNVSAFMDAATDSTRLRVSVHENYGDSFRTPNVELFHRQLEIVWGDRHFIQVRNTTQKALEHFARREAQLRGTA